MSEQASNMCNKFMIKLGLALLLLTGIQGEDCSPGRKCLTCAVGLPFHCTSCEKGFYLKRGGAYLSCEPCPLSCTECDNIYSCRKCIKGRYGSVCEDVCGNGCIDFTCDQKLGLCGCKTNFTGTNCDKCVDGKYGYIFSDCELDCPVHCKTCFSDTNCTQCVDGYYGQVCENICSDGCFSGRCHQSDGTCTSISCNQTPDKLCARCIQGRYGSNCTLICPQNCVSCTSEIACEVCKEGFWGHACENNCSRGCLENSCLKLSGFCLDGKCKSGFMGENCENCTAGRHGYNCNVDDTIRDSGASATVQDSHIFLQLQGFLIGLLLRLKNVTIT